MLKEIDVSFSMTIHLDLNLQASSDNITQLSERLSNEFRNVLEEQNLENLIFVDLYITKLTIEEQKPCEIFRQGTVYQYSPRFRQSLNDVFLDVSSVITYNHRDINLIKLKDPEIINDYSDPSRFKEQLATVVGRFFSNIEAVGWVDVNDSYAHKWKT